MRNFLKPLRRPRFFLSIAIFPLLIGKSDCPPIIEPPPEPNVSCQTNIPITIAARRCTRVEPPCFTSQSWRQGDTFEITGSSDVPTDTGDFNELELHTNRIESGDTIMRRVCQSPYYREIFFGGVAEYEYTLQGNLGRGLYSIGATGTNDFTVAITGVASQVPAVYDRPSDGVAQYLAAAGGTSTPVQYQWSANGVSLPGQNRDSILQVPSRNTEYRVSAFDGVTKRIASAGVILFLNNAPGDPTAAFTFTPANVGVPVTFNPSVSLGAITRWQWDFDWQGDVLETFDQTMNGPSGNTTLTYSRAGRKYVRLRVTTAAGNFHEIFQRVPVVAPAPVK